MTIGRPTANEIPNTSHEEDIVQCRLDILDSYAKLGQLMSTPAITKEAQARREWSISACRREIARMERDMLELRQQA